MKDISFLKNSGDSITSLFQSAIKTVSRLSPSEKLVFWLLALFFIGTSFSLLFKVNEYLLVEVPARGGTYVEGVAGSPRFINPLLAITGADRDLTAIVYSGLMKRTLEGKLIPDLAESYGVGDDGLSYRFIIRSDAVFHDNKPITADDVVFTVGTRNSKQGVNKTRRASDTLNVCATSCRNLYE